MKKFSRIMSMLLVLMLMCITSISVFADSIPSKPASNTYVDNAEILSESIEAEILSINNEFDGEAYIYVVTVTSTGSLSAQEMAWEIFSSWEIGGDDQNGALLLLSLGEETSVGPTYYAIVGSGMSYSFEDGVLESILANDVEPFFSVADYDSAVQSFIYTSKDLIAETIVDTSTSSTTSTNDDESTGGFWSAVWNVLEVILIIVLIVAIIIVAGLLFLSYRAAEIKKKRRANKATSSSGRRRPRPTNTQLAKQEDEYEEIEIEEADEDEYSEEVQPMDEIHEIEKIQEFDPTLIQPMTKDEFEDINSNS